MSPALRLRYAITTARPIIALAPMAGVTDVPFRRLCEQLGADYSVTEMAASAPQLLSSEKNQTRLHFTPQARVKILQIIGNHADNMAYAAAHYADLGAEIIDINLGCPAKKISSKGAGSALLSDLSLVKRILQAVTAVSPVPVTVKTRLGPSHDCYTLFEVATIAESLGVELLTVHGRTRACRFNGRAQFDEIARVKQAFPQLAIIANGDIDSLQRAEEILQHTDCDGLMIGRSAVGNPWLFSTIRQRFDKTFVPITNQIQIQILNHIQATHEFYGSVKGVRFARKHIQAYLQQLGLSAYFSELATLIDADTQLTTLQDILATQPLLIP